MFRRKLATLVIDPFSQETLDILRQHPLLDCDYRPDLTEEDFVSGLAGTEVLFIRGSREFRAEHFESAKQLQYICLAASAPDKIDLAAASQYGVEILYVPGISYEATAELAIANTINLLRFVPQADRMMKNGVWNRRSLIGESIRGKKALIIGYGKMGSQIAEHLESFGVSISVWNRSQIADLKVEQVDSLHVGVSDADIIYLCVPATPSTEGLVNRKLIESMKPSALIINVSRGSVVDEAALYHSLKMNHIRGAAIDVWQEEPTFNRELAALENVIATPHLGGNTHDTHHKFIQSLLSFLEEKFPPSVAEISVCLR